ncbi:rhodanese-like domain-containing protein [Streptomyces sp. NPDC012935]|uniref:MBL fold metallo-hydrolase n=1 Tax=Streptomyces sp. NPDC012935 TaxID=3364857 RepID=UPI0036CF204D
MGFADDHLIALVDEGLGNSAYLVDLGDGRALAVDVSRDLRAVRAESQRRGLAIAFAADTHLHADFLTGALQLAADDGARVLASAAGQRDFGHRGLTDGDEVDLGGLTLRALATPGHTDEHLAFLLLDGERELGVFSGGSLIVGSVARTDLLGADRAEELARAQYRSLHRLARLPDATAVWPTHGAGSFCSAPQGAERTTTIGAERRSNDLLTAPDEDSFVRQLLGGLGSYPAYFDRLAEVNRRGPEVLAAAPSLPGLSASDVRQLLGLGAQIVDVRPVEDFAAGHVPGALSIHLRDQFAVWLGWLLPEGAPLVFVTAPGQDLAGLTWQALKIGHDRLHGHLTMDAWTADGGERESVEFVAADGVGGRPVLDVRQQSEWDAGHIPDAVGIELGALPTRTDEAPRSPVVHCTRGERAMTAASVLQREGHTNVSVLKGGPTDWSRATDRPLQTSA